MNKGKWIPKILPGIEYDNPVAEEFDTEKHPISASLGNEDGQNKIDATLTDKKGKVSIRYETLENNNFFKNYLPSICLSNSLKRLYTLNSSIIVGHALSKYCILPSTRPNARIICCITPNVIAPVTIAGAKNT